MKLRSQLQSIENDPNLDPTEKSKRKQNLLLLHNLNLGSPVTTSYLGSLGLTPAANAMSPHARAFYPAGETVESVVGEGMAPGENRLVLEKLFYEKNCKWLRFTYLVQYSRKVYCQTLMIANYLIEF